MNSLNERNQKCSSFFYITQSPVFNTHIYLLEILFWNVTLWLLTDEAVEHRKNYTIYVLNTLTIIYYNHEFHHPATGSNNGLNNNMINLIHLKLTKASVLIIITYTIPVKYL